MVRWRAHGRSKRSRPGRHCAAPCRIRVKARGSRAGRPFTSAPGRTRLGQGHHGGAAAATTKADRERILSMMIDPFGSAISYVRISVTDRCDFRCVYCMAEDMTFLPKKELLTLEELDRLCRAFVDLGVRKIRLTGGEPLVRRNIMSLLQSLGRHLRSGALDELTLTTNGSQLDRFAAELYGYGVRRVNVSLDTLDPRAVPGDHPLGQVRQGDGRHRRSQGGRPAPQDQHGRAQGGERGRARPDDRVVRRRGLRSDPDRDHAARRHRRRPDGSVSAALAGSRSPRAPLDADRPAGSHGRSGALCADRGDRRPARLHHAAHPQFLRSRAIGCG